MKNPSRLSSEKQELFERLLAQSGIDASTKTTISRRTSPAASLSYGQKRMWFLHQFEPDKALYNLPLALRLQGPLDLIALSEALNEIVRRHETLRTTFTEVAGSPLQIIQPAQPLNITTIDLRQYPVPARESEMKRIAREQIQIAFDLTCSPLIRATLLQLDDAEHILLLVMHHIASDGWSLGVIKQEFAALYQAFHNKQNSPLSELPIQYADYAAWQQERLEGGIIQAQLDYWRKQLAGLPSLLELPARRARPPVQNHHAGEYEFQLSSALLHSLEDLGRKHGATLFMVLLAAFQTLLYRYSRQTDIAVGTPIAGRGIAETEGLIGFFLNMLVMRADFSGNPIFSKLLARVQDVALGAYSNQELPFEKLVEELQPERDLSQSPLFQVMFMLQNTVAKQWTFPGLKIQEETVPIDRELFDLTLVMKQDEQRLKGLLIYRTDLYSPKMIAQVGLHFQNLLQSIADNPETPVRSLSLLSREERRHVLEGWSHGPQSPAADVCVHELFERQAERTPERISVVDKNQTLTYAELNSRANQLAHYLRRLGVERESLVAICLEPGADMVAGLLGILKAGGSYLPLDAHYPPERLRYVLEDSRVSVLLTQESLLQNLTMFTGRIIRFDSERARIGQESSGNLQNLAAFGNRAYVLYTSGSTGKPKGVEITHQALTAFLVAMLREPGLEAEDRLLAVTTLTFDIAGLELYLPLIAGARLKIAARDVCLDGSRLLASLDGLTVMQATPATWTLLLNAGWEGSSRLKILCGGETLTSELAHKLLERSRSLWNMYGPTETTIWSLVQHVDGAEERIAIGHPIANTNVYVLDEEMEPAPVGVTGELYIGGCGLARGYLNRPELTAEKFVPEPFSGRAGGRLYRTGDQVRWNTQGRIEFVGRMDNQVKVRGHRIELGEIESVLREDTRVGEAVAVVREDEPGDQRLVAYVVKKPGYILDVGELNALLKKNLPSYMLPSCIVPLEKLPLTSSGKVCRRALPPPGEAVEGQAHKYVAPATPTEKKLAEIWAEVLRVERVGADDSFLELGGHSLLATQITSRVQRTFGVELPLLTFFEQPSVAEIALLIDNRELAKTKERGNPVTRKKPLQVATNRR